MNETQNKLGELLRFSLQELAPDGRHYHQDGKVRFRSVTLEYEQGWGKRSPILLTLWDCNKKPTV